MKKAVKTLSTLALAILLALGLCLPAGALPVYAGEAGGCTHQHDGNCGYAEATPCAHVCGEACAEGCVHTGHDAACGYAEAALCTHVHDEACGGLAAQPSVEPPPVVVAGFDALPQDVAEQTVEAGATLADLVLPDTLAATGEGGEKLEITGVEWACDDPATGFDGETPGQYRFAPALPQGTAAGEGVDLPRITVTVRPAEEETMMPMSLSLDLTAGTWTGANGHRYIEFGSYNGHTLRWRVLEVTISNGSDGNTNGNKTAFLVLDDVLRTAGGIPELRQFNSAQNSTWATSEICAFLNDTGSGQFLAGFSSAEQGALLDTTLSELAGTPSSRVFLLSRPEAGNGSYFANNADRAVGVSWWVRTPVDTTGAYNVGYDGSNIYSGGMATNRDAVRPALKVDLGNTVFDASTVSYEVKITVQENSTPVPGARVETGGITAYTNSSGVASLTLPADTYTVAVSKAGYLDGQENIAVTSTTLAHTIPLTRNNSLPDRVYFGKYGGSPILWRVLDVGGGRALLLADAAVESMMRFDNMGNGNWTTSSIRTWLNGSSFLSGFSAMETGAIPATTYALGGNYDYGGYGYATQDETQMFLLSVEEAGLYLPDNAVRNISGDWWLRSPGDGSSNAALMASGGAVNTDGSSANNSYAIRPAFHLDLTSVFFTSAAAGGKPAVGGPSLSAATPPTAAKCTLFDSAQTLSLTATTAQSTQSVPTTGSLTFSYSNATTGAGQRVSCILTQGSGEELKYYGGLVDTSTAPASGTLSIPLSGVDDGTYTLKVFSEKVNGDNLTDYASTPITMTVTVSGGQGTVSNFGGTVLSDDAGLSTVAGQAVTAGSEAGGIATPKTAAITVANSVTSIATSDIIPATGAAATLYSGSGFTTTAASINLTEGGATHLYIKVVAEDGTTLYYDVTVNRAGQPTLTATPASLAFGDQAISVPSAGKIVTVSSTDLTGNITYSIGGVNAADFTVTETSWSAASGGILTVTFTPSAAGARSAALTISSQGAADKTVTLAGTGIAPPTPTLAVSPASLAFDPQTVGTTSTARTVTVAGAALTGNITYNIIGTDAGYFTATQGSGWSATTGGTLHVTYTPAATGNHSATLTISGPGAAPQTVALTGEGVNAETADSGQNTFAVGGGLTQTAGKAFTITATGHRQNVATGTAVGETRYIPVKAEANPTVNFTESGGVYSAQMTIANAGSYTLTITYRLEQWNGSAWVDTGATDTKTATLTVKAADSSSNPPASSSTPGTTSGSPQTGDGSNVGLWVALLCASLAALGAGVWVLVKRRKPGPKENS